MPPRTTPKPSFTPLFVRPPVAAAAALEDEDAADEAAEALLEVAEAPAEEPADAALEVAEATLPVPLPVVDPPVVLAGAEVALPELAAVVDEESSTVVRTPPINAAGAEAAGTA